MTTHLPLELWRSIFREATYVPDLLSTRWDYDPEDRIWESWFGEKLNSRKNIDEQLGTKCAIVEVCRGWREAGTEFLYEVIQIRPNSNRLVLPRLSTLIQALTASNSTARSQSTTGYVSYGWWTKRITFHPAVIGNDIFEHLFALLEQCHNLEILSLSTASNALEVTHLRLLRLLESRFSHSLRRLDNYLFAEATHFEVAPNGIPKLASLGVILRNKTPNPIDGGASFKKITTLTLWSLSTFNTFPSQWTFPSLMSLSLRGMSHDDASAVMQFVNRHSHTLLHLHLHLPVSWSRNHQTPILLSNVPGLRSVSLRRSDLDSFGNWRATGKPFPKLAYLGIISNPDSQDSGLWTRDSLNNVLDEGLLPELRVIRLLSSKNTVSPGFT